MLFSPIFHPPKKVGVISPYLQVVFRGPPSMDSKGWDLEILDFCGVFRGPPAVPPEDQSARCGDWKPWSGNLRTGGDSRFSLFVDICFQIDMVLSFYS